MDFPIGAAFGPLLALFLFGFVALGIKLAIARYMPECWLKRQLLAERIKTAYSASNRRILEESARCASRKADSVIRSGDSAL